MDGSRIAGTPTAGSRISRLVVLPPRLQGRQPVRRLQAQLLHHFAAQKKQRLNQSDCIASETFKEEGPGQQSAATEETPSQFKAFASDASFCISSPASCSGQNSSVYMREQQVQPFRGCQ